MSAPADPPAAVKDLPASPLSGSPTKATKPTRPPPVKAYKEGRETFYKLCREELYTPAELTFLKRRFSDLAERVNQGISPRVVLICDHDMHFLANAVLLTLLGCEVEACRNVSNAMQIIAPQFRHMEYSPPDLIIIEKWKSGRTGADYSVRDLCYHIRSRDQQYTKDTGFICRSNIIGIATPNLTIFDASDSSADLVLRGTLFRNLDMVRKLILPAAVISQGRLRVHRAASNFSKIQRLLQPAPVAPNIDGTIKLDDELTQALAFERVAGGLEQQIDYLKDVIRIRDKEMAQVKRAQSDVNDQHESDKARLNATIAQLRKANTDLEEDKGRIMAHAAKLKEELKATSAQSKLLQVQMQNKTKLTKIRQQTKSAEDEMGSSTKSRGFEVDEATAAAWAKMSFSSMRMAAMAPASTSVAVQCTILQPTRPTPTATRSMFNGSITSTASFAPMQMLPGIQIVDEVVGSPKHGPADGAADRIKALEVAVKELEERLAAADQRASSLSTQLMDAQAKLTSAVTDLRDMRSATDGSSSRLAELEFENGRLQEMIAIAKDDRSEAQRVAADAEKEMLQLRETVALLQSRLRDDESLIVDKRVALDREAEAQRSADKSLSSDMQRAFKRRQAKDMLLRCVLLAALTKRTSQTEVLQRAIEAADAKVQELKATIKEGRKGGGGMKGSTKHDASADNDAEANAKPEKKVRTRTAETGPDPAFDLWVAFQKQAASLAEVEANFGRVQQLYKDARSLVNPIEKELDATKASVAAAVKAKAAAEEAAEKSAKEAQLAKEEMEHHFFMSNKQKLEIGELKEQVGNLNRQVGVSSQQTQAAVAAAKEYELECVRLRELVQALQRRITELEMYNTSTSNVLASTKEELKKLTKASNLSERMSHESSQRITAAEEIAQAASRECELLRSRVAELEEALQQQQQQQHTQSESSRGQSSSEPPLPQQLSAAQKATEAARRTSIEIQRRRESVISNPSREFKDEEQRSSNVSGTPSRRLTAEGNVLGGEGEGLDPLDLASRSTALDDVPSAAPVAESSSVSSPRIVYRTRVVVGDVDESKLNELREEITELQKLNADLEEKLKASRRELGESRGLVGTYKDSQASLRRETEEAAVTMQRQADELKALNEAVAAMKDTEARLAPLRSQLAISIATWGSISRNGPYDVSDDGSERWAYAAAHFCIEHGIQVMSVMNRAKVTTIDNLTQTVGSWTPAQGERIATGEKAVQASATVDDAGTYMLTPDYTSFEQQTDSAEPTATVAGNDVETQTDDLPPPTPLRDAPPHHPVPLHPALGAIPSSRASTVDTPTAPLADPPQRDSEHGSRQVSRNSTRIALVSRERGATRLPLDEAALEKSGSRGGATLPPLLAKRSQPTTPHHANQQRATLLHSSGVYGEVLFETDTRGTQTDSPLPAPVTPSVETVVAPQRIGAPLVSAETQTEHASSSDVALSPVSQSLPTAPPPTPPTVVEVTRIQMRSAESQTSATVSVVVAATQSNLTGDVVAAVEPPEVLSRFTAMTPVTAAAPPRPRSFVEASTQAHPVSVNTVHTQATAHPVSLGHAGSQTTKLITVQATCQTDKRRKPTADIGVQITDELGVSASAAAIQRIVSAVANLHRALHTLYFKAIHSISTAEGIPLPSTAIVSSAKKALEALEVDTATAVALSDALAKWIKFERRAAADASDGNRGVEKGGTGSPTRHRAQVAPSASDEATAAGNGGTSPPPRPRPGVPVYRLADDPPLSPLDTVFGPISFATGVPVALVAGSRGHGNRTPSPLSRMGRRLPSLAQTPEPVSSHQQQQQQRLIHISSSHLLGRAPPLLHTQQPRREHTGPSSSPPRLGGSGGQTTSPLRVSPPPSNQPRTQAVIRMR